MKLYPLHSFICFMAAIQINSERFQPPCVSTIIVSSKSPAVISKLKCFLIEDYIEHEQETGERFHINLYLQVYKVLSCILYTISKNFHLLCGHPSIGLLSVDEFKTLLKHKRFQVYSEDEVIKALYMWQLDNRNGTAQISQVLNDINWNYVSLPCLVQLV